MHARSGCYQTSHPLSSKRGIFDRRRTRLSVAPDQLNFVGRRGLDTQRGLVARRHPHSARLEIPQTSRVDQGRLYARGHDCVKTIRQMLTTSTLVLAAHAGFREILESYKTPLPGRYSRNLEPRTSHALTAPNTATRSRIEWRPAFAAICTESPQFCLNLRRQ